MFNLEEFVDNPSVGALTTLQKKEWISLATAYQLEPRPNLTKTQLQRLVLEHFMEEEILDRDEVQGQFSSSSGDTEEARNKLPLAQSSHKVNPYPSGPREPAALSPLQGRPRFAPVSSVTILRDSGSVRTFVLREAISSFPQCQTGHSLVVRGLFSKGEVPLCKIFLQSAVMTGYVSAGIVNELPVAGVSMILGNDVAGSSMFPHSPSVSPNCASPEQEPSEVSPACVVTRSHSRRLVKDSFSVPQVANPPPENIVSDSPTPEFALDEFFNNASQESNVPDQTSLSEPVIRSIADMAVTRTTLIAEQAKDPNWKKCFDHASKFCGPYKVLKKESSVNYLISTPDRRKKTRLVHINLLKEYKSRDVAVTELTAESQCLVVTSSPDVEESDITRCSHLVEPNDHEEERANAVVEPVLHNSQVLKNPGENLTHLQEEQAASIVHLLQEHVALFSDSPSLCPLLRHDVDVQDSHPVRQPPYRLNAEKR
ncbi:hypothetical protein Pmani_000873 [Petrolisthes manimaculis]|uniref:Integrase p58-like C-terminal domain-containing protein n=1 Tax=Petrolisthes manimaculis TaxID=1843537 RepID=A0AAE1QP01_9EUCA|nr:hypothetical protein Pmani_000873 [Petrolisthes manimaculis]